MTSTASSTGQWYRLGIVVSFDPRTKWCVLDQPRWGCWAVPMTIEYIRYRIPQERLGEFESAYERAAGALRAAPQCVDYELSRCLDDHACYVLRITWTSVEDHLRGFRGGPQFGEFFAAIKP